MSLSSGIVDLERYPIDERKGNRLREVIDEAKRKYNKDGKTTTLNIPQAVRI